jgi:hypothetical protein
MAKKPAKKPGGEVKNPAGPPPKQPNNKSNTQSGPDAMGLLRYEHRALENLFSQFNERKDPQLARRICAQIELHSRLEEQDFYSEVEEIPDVFDRADKGLREHRQMDELIEAIGQLEAGEALNDGMSALREAVEQHIREEERSVFPAVARSMSKRSLAELTTRLAATKANLATTPGEPDSRRSAREDEPKARIA